MDLTADAEDKKKSADHSDGVSRTESTYSLDLSRVVTLINVWYWVLASVMR